MNPRLSLPAMLVALLNGCAATLPGDPSKMTPEQLKAQSADKAAQAACTRGTGPWGAVVTVWAQWDKGSAAGGTLSVDDNCKMTFSAEQKTPFSAAPAAGAPRQ